ncbi:hypothetical protein J6O48_02200 [bacterium]|nr:hypothetical protein [bacterium]
MKNLLVLVLMLSVVPIAHATHVRGHYRSNGTYVTPYNRTRANYTKMDNYSTRGNSNPYTGKWGTTNPHRYSNTYRTRSYKKL